MFDTYLVGKSLSEVPTPALVVDIEKLDYNIHVMSTFLREKDVSLRPHTKTHKCPAIAHRQLKAGASGVCCATIGEAEAMVYNGIPSVFIANELTTTNTISRLVHLARQAEVLVAVDDVENIKQIAEAADAAGARVGLIIDIDVGMGRCGADSIDEALVYAEAIARQPSVHLKGLMGYEGHAVFLTNRDEREQVGKAAHQKLVDTAQGLRAAGYRIDVVSAAGTGTYDIASMNPGITEIEAGSYVFMDSHYARNNLPFKQSLTVMTAVISRPREGIAIFDTGLKAVSHERSLPLVMDRDDITIVKLSEEHAIGEIQSDRAPVRLGEIFHLIPSHCCTTVNLYDKLVVSRKGIVEAVWPISGRRA